MNRLKKTLKISIFVLFLLGVSLQMFTIPLADAQVEDAEELEARLREIEQRQQELSSEKKTIQRDIDENNYLVGIYNQEASQLLGEIAIFQRDIESLELEIEEIELSIETLNIEIEEKKIEIEVSQKNIDSLKDESDARIEEGYMNYRLYGDTKRTAGHLLDLDGAKTYFKESKYRDIIQSDTNSIIEVIADLKRGLESKQEELEMALVEVKKRKESVEAKRIDLERQRSDLQARMQNYYAVINDINSRTAESQAIISVLDQETAENSAEAERIRQELFNNFIPPNDGEYVAVGRPIGIQGCTGLCTGPHLHFSIQDNGNWQDPCGYLPGGVVSGCGWGNKVQWPMQGSPVFTSAYGNRCFMWGASQYCDFHTGADFAGPPNATIYSAHEGWLYRGTDQFGANYAIICQNADCNVGLKTGYWHLQ